MNLAVSTGELQCWRHKVFIMWTTGQAPSKVWLEKSLQLKHQPACQPATLPACQPASQRKCVMTPMRILLWSRSNSRCNYGPVMSPIGHGLADPPTSVGPIARRITYVSYNFSTWADFYHSAHCVIGHKEKKDYFWIGIVQFPPCSKSVIFLFLKIAQAGGEPGNIFLS